MITIDSISVDASEAGFVNVKYLQINDGVDMSGRLCFELQSLPAVVEMIYNSLNVYGTGEIERSVGQDSFRVYESGADYQPITNILNRRPVGAAKNGLSGLMMTRAAAEDLLKQLLALPPETSLNVTVKLNEQLWKFAAEGNSENVDSVLRQGANVNARGQFGDSALNMAAEKGHTDAVTILLKAGANVENIGGADKTPLMNAAFAGKVKVVELLLDQNARINRDLLNTLQLKVNILEENAEAGMVLPESVGAWQDFLDFMVEKWRAQNPPGDA